MRNTARKPSTSIIIYFLKVKNRVLFPTTNALSSSAYQFRSPPLFKAPNIIASHIIAFIDIGTE